MVDPEVPHTEKNPGQNLKGKLLPGKKSLGLFFQDLQVIVQKSDDTIGTKGAQNHPDIRIGQVRPQEGRHKNPEEDQNPSHRRRSLFGQMRFGSVVPDLLSDLEPAKPLGPSSRTSCPI
jgi:hypothetical protein